MGLPVNRFVAANNRNDVFFRYLETGLYQPKSSVQTIANAMDVGAPSNFDRILDLYHGEHASIATDISGNTYNDDEIRTTIRETYERTGYLLDPHGACAYRALKERKKSNEKGIFLATAHPAKFKEVVENCIGKTLEIPERLSEFMRQPKQSISLPNDFDRFKKMLLEFS